MNLTGSMCAIATPFAPDGGLDLKAFGRLIDYQIAGGTQALIVAGSTGESHFLTPDEFTRLVEFAVRHVDARVPVVVGSGAAGTAATVAATRHVAALGADAALVGTPYYVGPTQEGMRRHFLDVADAAGLPVLVYNVPSRTACDMLPTTVAQLRTHPAIVGIKEAVGDGERIHALAELAGPDFVYLSGDDYSACEAMLAGAGGTISVVANLVPGLFRQLCDAACAGDKDAAGSCMAALNPLLDALRCAPNPIPVKAGLAMLGFGDGSLRLPLIELADGPARDRVREALATLVPDALVA
ncbi:MAG TPA: 4-hydroxy-tetrahydrodipicolinate synthase [Oleiagrimonas sp.]|nr:4-hydroxy-tetrahydrodipicolinate synthase [Oleiagrimonas sp.]